jgi:cytochrome c-type biogenesis protein CcmH
MSTAVSPLAGRGRLGTNGASGDARRPGGVAGAVLSLVSSRPAWLLAAVALAVALAVGSVHPAQASSSERISYLDSVIKCPSCVDLSIAQSEAPIAVGLRAEVAAWVHEGLSNARIEQLVVARFGEQVLLVPSGSGAAIWLWAAPLTVLTAAVLALGAHLWRRRRLGALP